MFTVEERLMLVEGLVERVFPFSIFLLYPQHSFLIVLFFLLFLQV
jgi:hypothetical protein